MFKNNHNSYLVSVIGLGCFFTGLVFPVISQPSPDPRATRVLDELRQRYEQSIRNIDNYTVVTDQYTIYYEKVMDGDRAFFKSRILEDSPGQMQTATAASQADLFAPEVYEKIKQEAGYAGREVFTDYRVHILRVDEIDGLLAESEDMPARLEDIMIYEAKGL